MLNSGSLSWIVISRCPNSFVDEAYEEPEELQLDEEMVRNAIIEDRSRNSNKNNRAYR